MVAVFSLVGMAFGFALRVFVDLWLFFSLSVRKDACFVFKVGFLVTGV